MQDGRIQLKVDREQSTEACEGKMRAGVGIEYVSTGLLAPSNNAKKLPERKAPRNCCLPAGVEREHHGPSPRPRVFC